MNKINIDTLITIDETGMPKAPNVRQLQDKDVALLYARDYSKDKNKYIKECGVIYYLADPKSPANQQGLSKEEALNLAIENYDLPKDYKPDALVEKLIVKYYKQNITEAGVAVEVLQKSIHLSTLMANKINEILATKYKNLKEEDIGTVLSLMDNVANKIKDIPNLVKSINQAYENLRSEEETNYARGGVQILSSMDADEDY